MLKYGELVTLNTQDVSKSPYPTTSSLLVAEKFEKRHDLVLRDVRSLEKRLHDSLSSDEKDVYKFEEVFYQDSYGRQQPYYLMNEDFFTMLVMGYKTKQAFKFKHKFIQAFKFAKNELNARVETRYIGKAIRKSLTNSIQDNVSDDGNFKKFAYSNYTKMIYKKVLGISTQKYRDRNGIQKGENIRNYLSIPQLEEVQKIESDIATIIEFSKSKDDKELYKEIKEYLKGGK